MNCRKRLFFDTNVLNHLQRLSPERQTAAWAKIHGSYDYVVSTFTAVELLAGIVKSDRNHAQSEEHLRNDLAKLTVLSGDYEFLAHPRHFALNTVLRLSTGDHAEKRFAELVGSLCECQSWADLDQVILNTKSFYEVIENARAKNSRMLARLRAKAKGASTDPIIHPTPVQWVRASLKTDDYVVDQLGLERLAEALTAAIAFNEFLATAAEKETYNFSLAKHDGDLIDIHQLITLGLVKENLEILLGF